MCSVAKPNCRCTAYARYDKIKGKTCLNIADTVKIVRKPHYIHWQKLPYILRSDGLNTIVSIPLGVQRIGNSFHDKYKQMFENRLLVFIKSFLYISVYYLFLLTLFIPTY